VRVRLMADADETLAYLGVPRIQQNATAARILDPRSADFTATRLPLCLEIDGNAEGMG